MPKLASFGDSKSSMCFACWMTQIAMFALNHSMVFRSIYVSQHICQELYTFSTSLFSHSCCLQGFRAPSPAASGIICSVVLIPDYSCPDNCCNHTTAAEELWSNPLEDSATEAVWPLAKAPLWCSQEGIDWQWAVQQLYFPQGFNFLKKTWRSDNLEARHHHSSKAAWNLTSTIHSATILRIGGISEYAERVRACLIKRTLQDYYP